MSQYTMNIENYVLSQNPKTYGNIDEMIKSGRDLIFDFAYNASPDFKNLFEEYFIVYYFENDINSYSFQLWKHRFEIAVKSRVPMYGARFDFIQKILDSDLTLTQKTEFLEKYNGQNESTGKSTSGGNSENKSSSSQFPQDLLNAGDFENVRYMDSGARSKSESASNSESETFSKTNDTREHVNSVSQNPLDILEKFTKNALTDVIDECVKSFSDFFLLVF